MSEIFAPPGESWQPVSAQLRRMRRTLLLVWLAVLGLALLAVWLMSWLTDGLSLAAGVLLVVGGGLGWLAIGRNARAWGYAERDEDLYIKHGALFRELIVVPYGRMQYVDVTSGPVERMYGVSTVSLHTASPGTSATIPGLPADEAVRLGTG